MTLNRSKLGHFKEKKQSTYEESFLKKIVHLSDV